MNSKLINILILALSSFALSCATTGGFTPGMGSKYKYMYVMVSPQESRDLFFQDDSIIAQFKFDEAAIRFQMQNISDSYLAIDWDRASISINGRHFPIRTSRNLYCDSAIVNSITLAPLGYVRDIAIPRNNIYHDGSKWTEVDLLPTMDNNSEILKESILKSVGKPVGFLVPMTFGSVKSNYEFVFQVDSVNRILWKDYEPFQRVPAPPQPKRSFLGLDNVTTAIIAVGVLGFSAYVLSIKKNPPSE
jgi:hypothetical protein